FELGSLDGEDPVPLVFGGGQGVVALRVVDSDGQPASGASVLFRCAEVDEPDTQAEGAMILTRDTVAFSLLGTDRRSFGELKSVVADELGRVTLEAIPCRFIEVK